MKKKILLISSILLTLSITIIIIFNSMDNKENNIISNIEKDKQVINSNMITMMYETESGSGIYEETKDTTWPESGYIFNENLSGCENGGELEYNSINKTVNLLSNKSDRCYVYFDKYDGVWIDNVSVTNVTGSSVTLNVGATSENGSITTYYYSLNDSEEYQESTSNVITINDLNKLTEYKISIYAVDSTNAKSNIYELNVSTTDESKPVINSVEVSNITSNGFTLTVNATSEYEINKYYFTINANGENVAGTSTTNQYTFNNLNENTNYNLLIFVEDINNNLSDKYSVSIQTTENKNLFANYIKNSYTTAGANGLYFHNTSYTNDAGDNSYRYAGANPNNYVCFGSDAATCPRENLYRIIGIFDDNNDGIYNVKLIMNDFPTTTILGNNYLSGTFSASRYDNYKGFLSSIPRYYWNGISNNYTFDWQTSPFNIESLNGTYLNYLGNSWNDKIRNTDWKICTNTERINYFIPQNIYFYEIASCSETYSAKIGLMYVSDYAYAWEPTYWNYYGMTNQSSSQEFNAIGIDKNWIHLGVPEMLLTVGGNYLYPYDIWEKGSIGLDISMWSYALPARPTFYLNNDIEYVSGNGSINNPYRII